MIVNKGPDQSAKCYSDESKESLFAKGRDVDERNRYTFWQKCCCWFVNVTLSDHIFAINQELRILNNKFITTFGFLC